MAMGQETSSHSASFEESVDLEVKVEGQFFSPLYSLPSLDDTPLAHEGLSRLAYVPIPVSKKCLHVYMGEEDGGVWGHPFMQPVIMDAILVAQKHTDSFEELGCFL